MNSEEAYRRYVSSYKSEAKESLLARQRAFNDDLEKIKKHYRLLNVFEVLGIFILLGGFCNTISDGLDGFNFVAMLIGGVSLCCTRNCERQKEQLPVLIVAIDEALSGKQRPWHEVFSDIEGLRHIKQKA